MVTIIMGPMMSGKSSELLRYLERGIRGKKKVCLIRPGNDVREFFSHSEGSQTVFENLKLTVFNFPKDDLPLDYDIFIKDLENYDIIGIDECQFIDYLKDFVIQLIKMKKEVYLSGLLATSEREMFKPITEVLPYCSNIVKLNSVCVDCGNDFGNYTRYKAGKKTESIVVGGSEAYDAICDDCLFETLI